MEASVIDSFDACVRERRMQMIRPIWFGLLSAVCLLGLIAIAQERGVVIAPVLLSEVVQGMPKGECQKERVFTESFRPGDQTMFHTHRFHVTVYVLEGAFTLEMKGLSRSRSKLMGRL